MSKTVTINGKKYDASTGEPVSARKQTARRLHAQAVHRKPERARTLMRSIVKHPSVQHATTPTSNKKSAASHATSIRSKSAIIPTFSPIVISSQRTARAKSIRKSSLVSRFSESSFMPKIVRKQEPIAVQPEPPANLTHHPVANNFIPPSENSAFAHAVRHATSHTQTHNKHTAKQRIAKKLGSKARAYSMGASILAVVILSGFFYIQSAPNREFRAAANRAGLAAAMPTYTPSGFSPIGSPEAAPGRLVIRFGTRSDQRNYTITQTASNWSSQTLLDRYIATSRQPYQTVETTDKIIYTYDQSKATWVKDGIWYQIESDAGLSTEQLLNIAASM